MITSGRKKKLLDRLKDKTYRDAFVASHIFNGIAFQIKTIREHKPFTQTELANLTGMKQERISVLENPNNSSVTINTLQRIASAFDVGLMIRFVPYSELVKWDISLSSDSLQVASYPEDTYFKEELTTELDVDIIAQANRPKANILYLQECREEHLMENIIPKELREPSKRNESPTYLSPQTKQSQIYAGNGREL